MTAAGEAPTVVEADIPSSLAEDALWHRICDWTAVTR